MIPKILTLLTLLFLVDPLNAADFEDASAPINTDHLFAQNSTNTPPVRGLWKAEDAEAIKRYQEHEHNVDTWIRRKMEEGGYAINELFYNADPRDSIDPKYSGIYQHAGYTYRWREQSDILKLRFGIRLKKIGLDNSRLGLEKKSLFLPPRIAEALQAQLTQAQWLDISNLVDELRLVKSAREMAYMQQAAAVTDAMMQAALDTARTGVSEKEIAAEVHRAMILAGGEYPGFTPFIRSTPRLGEEHTTWSDRVLQPGDALFLEMAGCMARYHAPVGRLVFVNEVPAGTVEMATVCLEAFQRVVGAMRPGVTAAQVYQAWQDRVDQAGLAHYRRHHCGYLVGIGFPPSWVGGSRVVGLRHDSPLKLQTGMTFHVLSWLMGAGRGNYFVSDAATLTENGGEVLTTVLQHVQIV